MIDANGKTYNIDVYSQPSSALNGRSDVFDYWYDGQTVLKQSDEKFKIRDSGVILTRIP